MFLAILSLFGFSVAHSLVGLFFLGILLGIATGTGAIVNITMAIKTLPLKYKGIILAMVLSSFDFGIVIGTSGLGIFTEWVSFNGIYRISAYIILVGVIVFGSVRFFGVPYKTGNEIQTKQ